MEISYSKEDQEASSNSDIFSEEDDENMRDNFAISDEDYKGSKSILNCLTFLRI